MFKDYGHIRKFTNDYRLAYNLNKMAAVAKRQNVHALSGMAFYRKKHYLEKYDCSQTVMKSNI